MRPGKPRKQVDPPALDPAMPKGDGPFSERSARLAQLKLAIDKGTYRISSERIADKLLERLRDGPAKA